MRVTAGTPDVLRDIRWTCGDMSLGFAMVPPQSAGHAEVPGEDGNPSNRSS
jgi:hypothetical protein